jgi:hypothetical protein
MNKKNFNKVNYNIILACFARSYDASHIKNKKIHLVSSVVHSTYEIDIDNIDFEFLREKIEKGMYRSTYYIFKVFPDVDDNLSNNIKVESDYFGCVRIINISFFTLIRCIENNGKLLDLSEDLTNELFGSKDSTEKDFYSILQDSVFIFYNLKWNSIVLFFKLRNIEISGGTISKRHLLDTVSSTLKEFLDLFYDYNTNFINKYIIYESFKNKDGILSSFINFEDKKEMDYNIEIKNILIKDMKWNDINNLVDTVNELKINNGITYNYFVIIEDYIRNFFSLVKL